MKSFNQRMGKIEKALREFEEPVQRCRNCGKPIRVHTVDQVLCSDCWAVKVSRNLLNR